MFSLRMLSQFTHVSSIFTHKNWKCIRSLAARRICRTLSLLHTNHSILIFFFLADSESSDLDSDNGVGDFAGGVAGASPPRADQREDSIHNSPRRSDHGDEQRDEEAEDRHDHLADDVPDMSDHDTDWVDPDSEGRLHSMSSHLSKLDSLAARGCADKFFKVHTARWAPSMPRPGDFLHSARAGGVDARETRKRKAAEITRSAAESHAFCTSSNLSQKRSDAHLETFTNGWMN